MPSTSRQITGRLGERLAAEYLLQCGYQILARNVRTAYGEIDLIALQETSSRLENSYSAGKVLVFVEVKTRRSGGFGLPEESITASKKAHMLAAAQAYLQTNPELDGDWRLDVIAVRLSKLQEAEIVHFESIVP